MYKFKIPDRFRPGFDKLLAASDEDISKLKAALATAKPAFATAQLAEQLSKTTPFSADNLEEILDALMSLFLFSDRHEVSDSEVTRFVESALESDEEFRQVPVERRSKIAASISQLLSGQVLGQVAKAADVMTDHSRVFWSARILTDIRPIFDEDVSTGAMAAALTHMLKITFGENGTEQEFFVALDSADIQKLRAVLDRAEKKIAALSETIIGTKLVYLQPTYQP